MTTYTSAEAAVQVYKLETLIDRALTTMRDFPLHRLAEPVGTLFRREQPLYLTVVLVSALRLMAWQFSVDMSYPRDGSPYNEVDFDDEYYDIIWDQAATNTEIGWMSLSDLLDTVDCGYKTRMVKVMECKHVKPSAQLTALQDTDRLTDTIVWGEPPKQAPLVTTDKVDPNKYRYAKLSPWDSSFSCGADRKSVV